MFRVCILLYCCLLLGCGGSKPYNVQAVVTLDSTPLAEAEVTLVPMGKKGKSAIGITNAEGKAAFKTDEVDGVFPGSYVVTISKEVEEKMLSNNEIRSFAAVGIRYRPKMIELVPEKFTRRENSNLKAKVGYWHSPILTFNLRTEELTP